MSLGPTGRMLCQPSAPQDTGIGLEAIETGPSCQRERPCRTAKGARHLFSVSLAPSPRLRFPVFPVLPSSRSYVSVSPLLPSPSAALPGSQLFAEPSAGCDIDPLTAGKRHRSRFRSGGDPWSIRDLRATSSYPNIRSPRNPCHPFHDLPAEVRTVWSMRGAVPRQYPLEQPASHASSLDLPRGLRLCNDCVNCLEPDRLPAVPSCGEGRLMGETDSAWAGASLVIH